MRPPHAFLFVGSLLVGCSTFEPSTYENRSTKDGNVVTATGKAADVAAGANTSHNCPSCADDQESDALPQDANQAPSKIEKSTERIADSATDTLTDEVSREINEAIRDAFD